MRGTKDEGKLGSPMFPRLHINDADKGWPRAPPRNKMALYEQLSIPSQRMDSTSSSSVVPLPPYSGSHLSPSTPLNHGRESDQRISNPCVLSEKLPHPSVVEVSSNLSMVRREEKLQDVTGDLKVSAPQHTHKDISLSNFSHFKNLSSKKMEEENCHKRISDSIAESALQKKRLSGDRNVRLLTASHDGMMESKIATPKFSALGENIGSQNVTVPVRNPAPFLAAGDRKSTDDTASGSVETDHTDTLKPSFPYSDQKFVSASSSTSGSSQNEEAFSSKNEDMGAVSEKRIIVSTPSTVRQSMPGARFEPECCTSIENEDQNPRNGLRKLNHSSLKTGNAEGPKTDAETVNVPAVSSSGITPDDVVKAIGEKQFWKARKAIVNQQRVFALQVFELHKLIKVQKLIASFPNMLLQRTLYPGKGSSMKEANLESPKDDPKDQSPKIHVSSKEKPIAMQISNVGSLNEIARTPHGQSQPQAQPQPQPQSPAVPQSPWCFPSAGSQWLVPVMSPSEGLVYKPYSGPYPPPVGFMAPIYGAQAKPGSFPGCFPPYMMNMSNAGSVGEDCFPKRTTSALSSQMSRVMPHCLGNLKEGERQGSSGSSNPGRTAVDALPLFPMEPSAQSSEHSEEQASRVIRVTPHNPRSATESVARIFQSIQKERKHRRS